MSLATLLQLDIKEAAIAKNTVNAISDKSNKVADKVLLRYGFTKLRSKNCHHAGVEQKMLERWRLTSDVTDVMFMELGRPKGNPKLLAAKSREQYIKVVRNFLKSSES